MALTADDIVAAFNAVYPDKTLADVIYAMNVGKTNTDAIFASEIDGPTLTRLLKLQKLQNDIARAQDAVLVLKAARETADGEAAAAVSAAQAAVTAAQDAYNAVANA